MRRRSKVRRRKAQSFMRDAAALIEQADKLMKISQGKCAVELDGKPAPTLAKIQSERNQKHRDMARERMKAASTVQRQAYQYSANITVTPRHKRRSLKDLRGHARRLRLRQLVKGTKPPV